MSNDQWPYFQIHDIRCTILSEVNYRDTKFCFSNDNPLIFYCKFYYLTDIFLENFDGWKSKFKLALFMSYLTDIAKSKWKPKLKCYTSFQLNFHASHSTAKLYIKSSEVKIQRY